MYAPHVDFLELPCRHLPPAFDGLKILHLSDLHITTWNRRLELWQPVLAELKSDVVAITGDLGHRSWLWKRSLPNIVRFVEPLHARLGTYFILGNHDSLKVVPELEAHGLKSLKNETVIMDPPALHKEQRGDQPRLALIGLHQHRRIDTDLLAAMRDVRASDFKLLLAHYPDLVFPAAAAHIDVCLAGHTHGGQICWPDGSPLFGADTLTRAQCTGTHRVNGTWMVVNRGLGVAGVRMRLFCPPQAILITLKRDVDA